MSCLRINPFEHVDAAVGEVEEFTLKKSECLEGRWMRMRAVRAYVSG